MKKVIIIGAGLSGMSTALTLAERGIASVLVSPFPSERAQSVMAAGGINAVEMGAAGERAAAGSLAAAGASADAAAAGAGGKTDPTDLQAHDSIESHIEDTLKGGRYLAGRQAVTGLCAEAPEILTYLEKAGAVFTRRPDGSIDRRAFGGQSHIRTAFCGACTGKQLVTALVMECRKYEVRGLIERRVWTDFHSALIADGRCYGVLVYDEATQQIYPLYGDAVVMACGGQNALFGKTTGSTTDDGYAVGRLFMQGAELKNMEMIQYHPTTLETSAKRMLVSEAARGEGGRLFYEKDGKRVYFMEDLYGPKGNLMPRDVISRAMAAVPSQVYLDVTFLGRKKIEERIPEIQELCLKYRGIDIAKEPIPVEPSVHFFMGGLAVHLNHETNIRDLFAVGECASIYHGANRLGGNSLLAAVYSGRVAARAIAERIGEGAAESGAPQAGKTSPTADLSKATETTAGAPEGTPDFTSFIREQQEELARGMASKSPYPAQYVKDVVAQDLTKNMGILRNAEDLKKGLAEIDFYLEATKSLKFDASVLPYFNFSLHGILVTARASLTAALFRQESRGAHYRTDHPEEREEYRAATILRYDEGKFTARLDREGSYEN